MEHFFMFHMKHQGENRRKILLLAFVLRQKDIIAIPKAVGKNHIDENIAAARIKLTEEDMEMLSASFPPPEDKVPMEKY